MTIYFSQPTDDCFTSSEKTMMVGQLAQKHEHIKVVDLIEVADIVIMPEMWHFHRECMADKQIAESGGKHIEYATVLND